MGRVWGGDWQLSMSKSVDFNLTLNMKHNVYICGDSSNSATNAVHLFHIAMTQHHFKWTSPWNEEIFFCLVSPKYLDILPHRASVDDWKMSPFTQEHIYFCKHCHVMVSFVPVTQRRALCACMSYHRCSLLTLGVQFNLKRSDWTQKTELGITLCRVNVA